MYIIINNLYDLNINIIKYKLLILYFVFFLFYKMGIKNILIKHSFNTYLNDSLVIYLFIFMCHEKCLHTLTRRRVPSGSLAVENLIFK